MATQVQKILYRARDLRRVTFFLLIAVALHLVAILTIPRPTPAALEPVQGLLVRLTHVQPRQDNVEAVMLNEDLRNRAATLVRRSTNPNAMSLSPPHQRSDDSQASANPASEARATPGNLERATDPEASALPFLWETTRDQARRTARDETDQTPRSKERAVSLDERPILPQLARVLSVRKKPGATRFADGLVKVVTAWGTEFCLRPVSANLQGGPIDVPVVATNCP